MKSVAVISTDWHIDMKNVELSKNLAAQQILLAKEVGVGGLICLGDVFDSKKAQPEIVLNCFKEILDMIQEAHLNLLCIAGNHDKTNPYSWSSYLKPFTDHPCFELVEKQKVVQMCGNVCVFQSYIKEQLWVEELQGFLKDAGTKYKGKKMYLFSHQAMNGSQNNDGSKIESGINQGLLFPFEKCFFGHYHNAQQPLPNAYHLGAWKQKNFGEDTHKGFYVLTQDENGGFDFDFHKSSFPEYTTFDVQASELTSDYIDKILETFKSTSDTNLRLRITGSTDELKALPYKTFNEAGIKIKTIDNLEKKMVEEGVQVQDYENEQTLIDAFKEFCEEKEFSFEEGLTYLKLAL